MKKIILLHIILLVSIVSFASNVQFNASATKTRVATGEQFQISYTINTNVSAFTPPNISDFRVLGGPNQSSSMQWVNGNMSQSISYSYILMAVKEGTFTISPATIKVGNEVVNSNPITITVVKGAAAPPQNQQQQAQQGQRNRNQGQQGSADNLGNNLFLRVVLDKTKVYLGEQITATYKVYLKVSVVQNAIKKLPALNGFWSQDIENNNQQAHVYSEVYEGSSYNVADLKKTILFPQRSGTLEIDPMEMECVVRSRSNRQSNNIFDQFFGSYEDVEYTIKSKPIKIEVMPLPAKDKPSSFVGAVGKFSMDAKLDKTKVKENDGINLSITITGSGNLKLIESLKPNIPSDIEQFEPKVNDKITTTSGGVSGSRTFEYLLIPRHAGQFKIDPIEFSYFNPITQKYQTIKSNEFVIDVEKGAESETMVLQSSGQKEDFKIIGSDIQFIKTENLQLNKKGDFFFGSSLFYTLLSLPLILFIAFLIVLKTYLKNNSNMILVKSRKANKLAIKRLANAKKLMGTNSQKLFYEELFKALYGYLSDRLSIPIADLSKENISEHLTTKKAEETTVKKLIETLDLCELARFAPINDVSEQNIYDSSIEIISKIENELK